MRRSVLLLCLVACGGRSRPAAATAGAAETEPPIRPAAGADCKDSEDCRKKCKDDLLPAACRRYGQFIQAATPLLALQQFADACRRRDGKACTLAGKLLDNEDTGVPQDNEGAVEFYKRGCELNDGEACENLGWAHQLGDGAFVDDLLAAEYHRRAARLYRLACDGGIADDCNGLGEMHRVGLVVELDEVRATRLFERACSGGSVTGCESLARHGGSAGLEKACSAASPEACCDLGHRYEHGRGVVTDYQRAAVMYQTACDAGSGRGCDLWGYLWEHGLGLAQDYAEAVTRYQKACGLNHVVGCYDLGRMYQHGMGVTQDDQRAVDIFEATCGDGAGPGCHSLAWMYQHGRGVSKSLSKALALYDKSCGRGEMEGCLGEARILEAGAGGITVDVDKARRLVEYACAKDHAPACYHLGRWALVGDMVPQDAHRARALFDKGCELGHTDSCDAKRELDQAALPGPSH